MYILCSHHQVHIKYKVYTMHRAGGGGSGVGGSMGHNGAHEHVFALQGPMTG